MFRPDVVVRFSGIESGNYYRQCIVYSTIKYQSFQRLTGRSIVASMKKGMIKYMVEYRELYYSGKATGSQMTEIEAPPGLSIFPDTMLYCCGIR